MEPSNRIRSLDAGDPGSVDHRPGTIDLQIVNTLPILAADQQDILKTSGGDEKSACPFPFKKSVGCHRRAVDYFGLLLSGQQPVDPRKDGPAGIIRSRGEFEGPNAIRAEKHKIGEGAAGIDAYSYHGRREEEMQF